MSRIRNEADLYAEVSSDELATVIGVERSNIWMTRHECAFCQYQHRARLVEEEARKIEWEIEDEGSMFLLNIDL